LSGQLKSPVTSEGNYRGLGSVIIESELLRAEFVRPGARMVSLLHKELNHEFLCQQSSEQFVRGAYDTPMGRDQSAGYDEMFPTIDECYIQQFPWRGTRLPDHGEVWSLNWDLHQESDFLGFSVHGVRLPYSLSRRVAFTDPARLRLSYTLENLSPFEMPYLWSSHPMLRVEPGARLVLPSECRVATVGMSVSGRLGGWGESITWPHHVDANGNTHDLSVLRSPEANDSEAYYFANPLSEGWCGLLIPSIACMLRLSFPTERVPFLGIVVGEGLKHDPRFFALPEPCSAPLARLDLSEKFTSGSRLPARGTHEWYLEFEAITGQS
jgi:hypothetical protein